MKIQNWSKVDSDATHAWKHDQLDHVVTIERGWVMKLNGVELKEADTRDEIYRTTIRWLRDNIQMDEETKRLAETVA